MYDQNKSDLKKVYKTTKYLTGNQDANILPSASNKYELANNMAKFFNDKVLKIRQEIILSKETTAFPHVSNSENVQLVRNTTCSMSKFKMVTLESTSEMLKEINSKTHPHDPVPMWLVKDCPDEILPIITNTVNKSFNECIFPSSLKHAVVRPSIKDLNDSSLA